MVSRNYKKKIFTNCPPLSTTWEVGYSFIVTRGARTNTYPMDSAHKKYGLIHYKLLYSYKSTTAHSAHQRYWLIQYNLLDSLKSTTTLYTNTDSFPALDFIGILFQSSTRILMSINVYSLPSLRRGLLQACSQI